MRTNFLLSLLLLSTSLTGFCTTWTITNSGTTFTPANITATIGDSVRFTISSAHQAEEVSLTTWTANSNTALSGGFLTAFGGGLVLPTQLGIGTHYYVCVPHASFGMKGTIVVQDKSTGIVESQSPTTISVYPNPSNGKFQFTIAGSPLAKNGTLKIYTIQGEKIYQSTITNTTSDVDLSNQPNGIYFVKIDNGQSVFTKKIVIQ